MASNSESTFGARLANAETMFTHIQSFSNYAPPAPNLSPGILSGRIKDVKN